VSVTALEQAPSDTQQSRARRMTWPITATVLTLGATAYISHFDPNEGGYPLCPLKALTGLDCPACGGLRCVHALTTGDVVGAMNQNLMAVIVLPIFAALGVVWLYRRWMGIEPEPTARSIAVQKYTVTAFFVAMIIFTIVRNIPGIPFIHSGWS